MLIQNYTSDPIPHDPIDPDNNWPQNEWMSEPPREYETAISRDGEFLEIRTGIVFAIAKPSRYSSAATYGVFWVVVGRNPGLGRQYYHQFDATTGAWISKYAPGGIDHLVTVSISLGRNRELWARHTVGGVRKLNPNTWTFDDSHAILPNTFTPAGGGYFAVDLSEDLYVCTTSNGQADGKVYVYQISTGTLVRSIVVGSNVFGLFLEDDHRAYAVCDDGQFVLVDYVAGRVLSSLRCQLLPDQPIDEKCFAWDPFSRRILTLEKELDDLTTGASNSVIRGYFPIPIPVRLTTPIPLSVPRAGRRVRVVTRAIGEGGEGIAGQVVTATATGDATLLGTRATTDALGYAVFNLVCDNAGSATIDVETET